MKDWIIIALVILLSAPAIAFSQDQPLTGEQVYQKVCVACHGSGVAGAPKVGDKEAWAPHITEGMDHLYHSALNGDGPMPPKGGDSSLSDAEVKAAVDYMVEKSK